MNGSAPNACAMGQRQSNDSFSALINTTCTNSQLYIAAYRATHQRHHARAACIEQLLLHRLQQIMLKGWWHVSSAY